MRKTIKIIIFFIFFIGLTVAFDVEKHVENGKSSVKITNVKADLTWVKSSATSSYASTDF